MKFSNLIVCFAAVASATKPLLYVDSFADATDVTTNCENLACTPVDASKILSKEAVANKTVGEYSPEQQTNMANNFKKLNTALDSYSKGDIEKIVGLVANLTRVMKKASKEEYQLYKYQWVKEFQQQIPDSFKVSKDVYNSKLVVNETLLQEHFINGTSLNHTLHQIGEIGKGVASDLKHEIRKVYKQVRGTLGYTPNHQLKKDAWYVLRHMKTVHHEVLPAIHDFNHYGEKQDHIVSDAAIVNLTVLLGMLVAVTLFLPFWSPMKFVAFVLGETIYTQLLS